jgi:UDP-N-acetylglucosamine--N-acetylmuramyl-(pentapeptide) pyrophosphoryl-undecaprenol N-acetylglucosamine transferase
LPTAAEDHQTANARQLSDAGAAILLKDKDAQEKLFSILNNLINDQDTSNKMAQKITAFAAPDAIDKIVKEIIKNDYMFVTLLPH